jgi:hypothetical protein
MAATEEEPRRARSSAPALGESFAGTIKARYPFWDAQYCGRTSWPRHRLPAERFRLQAAPEMMTAQQVILHIAEAERWWIHHTSKAKRTGLVVEPGSRAGIRDDHDAPDHNT